MVDRRLIYTYNTSFFLFRSRVYDHNLISMSTGHVNISIVLNTQYRHNIDKNGDQTKFKSCDENLLLKSIS